MCVVCCVCVGLDSSVEAERLIKQGLAEAEAWGDPDTQVLLLLQGVTLNTHCGRVPEESASMLQACYLSTISH